MPQGGSLRALHSWNIGQELFVDAVNGSDTTGNGSSGNPWASLQKAIDELRNTVSWVAAGQDVAVRIREGVYKASSAAVATMDIQFNNSARAPASNRYLIFTPDTGHEGKVVIQNPDGATGQKGCVRLQNTGAGLNSFMIWSGLEFDGEDVAKGAAGNGNSYGFYFSGNATNFNASCEIVDCDLHGFVATAGAPSSAQGIATEAGCDDRSVRRCRFHEIGSPSGTSDFQEHAIYQKSTGMQVVGCHIWGIVNGYCIQFYNSNANTFDNAIVAYCTLDGAEASGIIIHGDALGCVITSNVISNHCGRGTSSFGIEFFPAPTGAGTSTIDRILYGGNRGGNRSHTPGGWTITNEITDDPRYLDPATRNLRLLPNSQALGFGDTNYSLATDLDDNDRPDGSEDAGAYERHASNLEGDYTRFPKMKLAA